MKPKHVALVIISVVLIAGCVLVAGCTSQDTIANNSSNSSNLSDEKTLQPLSLEDPSKAIVGNWRYTFTSPKGEDSSLTYHINADNTGVLTTYSKSIGNKESSIHWLYDETKKSYIINYDTLNQQEYMRIYTDDEGTQYLVSLGGGYICTKL